MSGDRRGGKYTPAANGGKWLRTNKRLAIYLRDGLSCLYCGSGVEDGVRLQVDHYRRVQDGGGNRASNLVTACARCNNSKNNLTIRQWFARLREQGIDTKEVRRRCRKHMARRLAPYKAQANSILEARPEPTMKSALAVALQGAVDEAVDHFNHDMWLGPEP